MSGVPDATRDTASVSKKASSGTYMPEIAHTMPSGTVRIFVFFLKDNCIFLV